MTRVSCIVEGHGEVVSLPLLLRRIAQWRTPQTHVDVPLPIRVHRDRFLRKDEEFRRHLNLAAKKAGDEGWIVVLLDADDDCPATLGRALAERARAAVPHRRVSIILANREFESWFIGAAASLQGHRGFRASADDLAIEAEMPRDAKGWIRQRMQERSYGETTDQPAFTAEMDLQQALDRCRSFRKLCSEWDAFFMPAH